MLAGWIGKRRQDQMYMIGHDDSGMQPQLDPVIVQAAFQNYVSRSLGKNQTVPGSEGDEDRLVVALKVWETAAIRGLEESGQRSLGIACIRG